MGPYRRRGQQPVWTAIKLAAVSAVVSLVLEWSQYSSARWVIALAVVCGTRWLAARTFVRRGTVCGSQQPLQGRSLGSEQRSGQHGPTEQGWHGAATVDTHRQHRDRAAWRRLVGSAGVAAAWERLCNSIVQEFVYDSWFCQLSPDREFPAEVRWLLNNTFGQFCRRAKRVDWTPLLIRECSSTLCSTLELYRSAAGVIGPEQLRSLSAAEADAAIRRVLTESCSLHPAFSTPDGQYRTCRALAEAVLMHVLPAEDRACPMLMSMLRELFAACLIRSILASLAPYSIHKMLLNALSGGVNQRQPTPEQQQAAAEFHQKASESSHKELEHLQRQRSEMKSKSSLLASKVSTTTGAQGASYKTSIKRSRSLGDVKDAGSRSPMSTAAAAAAGVARTAASLTAKPFAGMWRESGGGLQGPQGFMGSVGAVKTVAQQLTLKKKFGSEARLANLKCSAVSLLAASPAASLGSDSPRSCSGLGYSGTPDHFNRSLPSTARGISAGGALTASTTAAGWASDGDSSAWSQPMTAALSSLGRGAGSAAGSSSQQYGRLTAQVVNAEMLNLDGKDCIVYKVRVADDRAEWMVTRRYRHFEALHKRLKDLPHYRDLAATLPPKRLLTARDAPFVIKRRDELDSYLQALLQHPYTATDPELLEFVSQHSQAYGMPAAADELQCIRPVSSHESQHHLQLMAVDNQPQHGAEVCPCSAGAVSDLQQQQQHHVTASCTAAGLGTPEGCQRGSAAAVGVPADRGIQQGPGMELSCCVLEQQQLCAATLGGIQREGAQRGGAQSSQQRTQLTKTQQAGFGLAESAMMHTQQQPQQLLRSGNCVGSSLAAAPLQQQAGQSSPFEQGQLVRQCLRQQGQQSVPQYAQQLLEHLDSIDPTFSLLQARGAPSMPGSPPVPNKILPELSGLLETTTSVRSPGAVKQISKQTSDAAHQVAVASVVAKQTAKGQEQAAAIIAATDGACSNSADGGTRTPGSTYASAAVLSSTAAAGVGADSDPDTAEQQLLLHQTVTEGLSAMQGGQSKLSYTAVCSSVLADAAGNPAGPLQQGLSIQQAAAVLRKQQGGTSSGLSSPHERPPGQSEALETADTGGSGAEVIDSSSWRPGTGDGSGRAAGSGSCIPALAAGGVYHECASAVGPDNAQDISLSWYAELLTWQDCQDRTGLIDPLYDLVSCVFELQTSGFVRRPVISIIRQLLSVLAGGTIDELLQKTLASSLSEANVSKQLDRMQAQLFPGGIWFARAAAAAATASTPAGGLPPRGPPIQPEKFLDWTPPADSDEVAEQLRQKLLSCTVPGPLLALVGRSAYYRAVADCFGVLQSRTLLYNLGLTLLETVLIALFPEIKGAVKHLHSNLCVGT